MSENKQFLASVEALHEMLSWIADFARRVGFSGKDLHQLELASEEALVNVIHHAYADLGGQIEIALFWSENSIRVEISDQGKFFNPQKFVPGLDLNKPLADREIGGLGVHLMRRCVDELLYTRKGDRNILTLIKKAHSSSME